MRSEKGIGAITLITVVVFLAAIGVGAYMYMQGATPVSTPVSTDTVTPTTVPEDVETPDDEVTIEVSGKNFEFTPSEITVKQGQTVTINFTSEDGGPHDLVIDEFDVATEQVASGETSSVTFVADQAGEFEYYCSVGNHREMGMVGTLVVE